MNGRLWEHQVIRDHHTMVMTRAYPAGAARSVATCRCGWTSTVATTDYPKQDEAVTAHWQGVVDRERTTA